jgi:hypothetical protein
VRAPVVAQNTDYQERRPLPDDRAHALPRLARAVLLHFRVPTPVLSRLYHAFIARLDAAYRDSSYFTRLKARLLAVFALLLLVWVPLNVAKLLLVRPPEIAPRLLLNGWIVFSVIWCIVVLRKGRLERAGNGLALMMSIPMHLVLVLLTPA